MGTRTNYTDEVDGKIGKMIKERRVTMGLSLLDLSQAINVSETQLRKYESGRTRLGAGRLAAIARELQKPPGYFFSEDEKGVLSIFDGKHKPTGIQHHKMCIDLSRNFLRIKDSAVQQGFSFLMRAVVCALEEENKK